MAPSHVSALVLPGATDAVTSVPLFLILVARHATAHEANEVGPSYVGAIALAQIRASRLPSLLVACPLVSRRPCLLGARPSRLKEVEVVPPRLPAGVDGLGAPRRASQTVPLRRPPPRDIPLSEEALGLPRRRGRAETASVIPTGP